jgi:hypothetical protein
MPNSTDTLFRGNGKRVCKLTYQLTILLAQPTFSRNVVMRIYLLIGHVMDVQLDRVVFAPPYSLIIFAFSLTVQGSEA